MSGSRWPHRLFVAFIVAVAVGAIASAAIAIYTVVVFLDVLENM